MDAEHLIVSPCIAIFSHMPNSIFPVAPAAFTRSCSKSAQAVKDRTIGSILITRNEGIFEISDIVVTTKTAHSLFGKVLNFLFKNFDVHTEIKPSNLSFLDAKALIAGLLELDQKHPDPAFELSENIDLVVSRIADAISIAEIFELLNMPKAEDCLDTL